MLRSVMEAELALHQASPGDRREIAVELSEPGILNQPDPEPVIQALSGEYDDGRGQHCVDHDRMDFLPTPWPEYGSWILSQQQRWKQLPRRVDYREVVEGCFDATTREIAKALGFEEPGPNLKGVKNFRVGDPFGYMKSQPFCAFAEQAELEIPPIEQRIARLSAWLAAAAGGRGLPNIEVRANDAFGALEQLASDLLKNMQFTQDALQEQKETLERTVNERLAEIDQHRRNAISIAEDADAASRAKSTFLANMSHEIRTPMTAILGYADLLTDPNLSASNRNNYLSVIRRSGEHLLSLINDILDLSKIEAGRLSLDIGRCNVVSLLAEVASLLRPRAEEHGVSLGIEYAGPIPETILADGNRLRQAVVNLAGNAVKFTEHGSIRIAVSFLPAWHGEIPAIAVEVIDTGIGIRSEILPHLFQPFRQGDASVSKAFGGTGLGLSISRHIAVLMGGELTATSVWGKGSTFTLTVPTGELTGIPMLAQPVEVEHDTAADNFVDSIADLKGIRVLLAEDGLDNRQLIEAFVRKAGAEIEAVENGRFAVDQAEAGSFDLILMDMNMPEMDGHEATRLLRAHDYRKPIVALTAYAMESDAAQCLASGCTEHLPKPINRARLIQTIARLVGRENSVSPLTPLPGGDSSGLAASAPFVEGARSPVRPAPLAAAEESVCQQEIIVSQFIDDPEMTPIIGGFVERLPGQLDAMRRSLTDGQYDELQRLAHTLKGAGGSYGYPSLTEACRRLEDTVKMQDCRAAEAALSALAAQIHAVQKGCAAGAHTGGTSP